MMLWRIFFFTCLFVSVCSFQYFHREDDSSESREKKGIYNDMCNVRGYGSCKTPNYQCQYYHCRCSPGYFKNENDECVICPELGQRCIDTCCGTIYREYSVCWNNVCQACIDSYGYDICSSPRSEVYVSATQIAMAISLVLAIFATFVLLYKLCQKTDARRVQQQRMAIAANRIDIADSRNSSNQSNGTLQRYVNERLRDAPPRYSRAPLQADVTPSAPSVQMLTPVHDNPPSYDQIDGRENRAFAADSVWTPPPYSQVINAHQPSNEDKEKDQSDGRPGNLPTNERSNHI